MLWTIWQGFWHRQSNFFWKTERPQFDDDFARCKALTLLALEHGARVDECVHYDYQAGNLLFLPRKCVSAESLHLHECVQVIQFLLEIGSDVEHQNMLGHTPLLDAAHVATGYLSEYSNALILMGASISATDPEGCNVLHLTVQVLERRSWCAQNICRSLLGPRPPGDIQHRLVNLLEAGCDPRAVDDNGLTPSCYICKSPISWVVWARALLEAGWDPKAIDGLSPDPVVPIATILDGTCVGYYRTPRGEWGRPFHATSTTARIEELEDDDLHIVQVPPIEHTSP